MSSSSPHEAGGRIATGYLDHAWLVTWIPVVLLAITPVLIFRGQLLVVADSWNVEEYSHGYLVPLIAAFMVWQRRHVLAAEPWTGSLLGPGVVVVGLGGFLLGQISSVPWVDVYSVWLVLVGTVLSLLGVRSFNVVWPALFLVFLAIPLPTFIYRGLSSELQLMSSEIGVAVIRLLGVSVYLEGNVIDLGSMKLQVVEACNGLRYLFPLVTLGYIAACFFRAPIWMRAVLVLATVPITVLMNSLRIGIIGVLADRFGRAQAEGFLHDFEGWVIFMACLIILFVLMWVLVRLSGDKRAFADIFALDLSAPESKGPVTHRRGMPRTAWATLVMIALFVIPLSALPSRQEVKPPREEFAAFPMQIGEWKGRRDRLESIYLDALRLDDYEKATFIREGVGLVGLFSAYYASQRIGQSAHSPRSCLPGGGWMMENFGQSVVPEVKINGSPLVVNRTVIKQGDDAQLVYYWFQQRGRTITNEYLVKWYVFVDALLRNRTDGALVRLVTPLGRGEDVANADQRLSEFASLVSKDLPKYIPN